MPSTYQFNKPTTSITGVPTLVCGNRLEPRTRSAEFNRSLRAEVRDPAWLLARQWQMKEFQAEDRGSPVAAAITMAYAPINQVSIGNQAAQPYDTAQQPLDAVVQAQAPVIGWGLRLQLGVQWARMLRRTLPNPTRTAELLVAFHQQYPLAVPVDEPVSPATYNLDFAIAQTTPEAYAIAKAVEGTALDGYQLLLAIATIVGQTPQNFTTFLSMQGTAGNAAESASLVKQAKKFLDWYNRVYYQNGQLSQGLAAWSVPELAYQFHATAADVNGAPVDVQAREHLGEAMDWYTVDEVLREVQGESKPDSVKFLTSTLVPTEIQFTGAPNARWWEFEDAKVDFGQITADASDLGRMLLQEFMFLYHNDWFSVPYTVPSGSLCTVTQLTMTDVFGRSYAIQPAGYSDLKEEGVNSSINVDKDWGRWSLYALSQVGDRQTSKPRLLLPPTSVGTMMGPVLEQVYLAREEATNMVWGVEQIIPNQLGRGMDGNGAATRVTEYLRSHAQPVTPLASAAKREYQLATPTTENWIPFVLSLKPDGAILEQGAMLRQVDGLPLVHDSLRNDLIIEPRTSLLLYPDTDYLIRQRQVPPVGVRVEGNYRRARWFNGKTFTWYGRRRGNGRSVGGSGLAYDQLLAREVRTEVLPFAITSAQYITAANASGQAQLSSVAGNIPLLDRVTLRELTAAGTPLPPPAPVLDLTRVQLVQMLLNKDTFWIANTQDPVLLVTVGGATYVQRQSLSTPLTAGDKLGNFPPIPVNTQ